MRSAQQRGRRQLPRRAGLPALSGPAVHQCLREPEQEFAAAGWRHLRGPAEGLQRLPEMGGGLLVSQGAERVTPGQAGILNGAKGNAGAFPGAGLGRYRP